MNRHYFEGFQRVFLNDLYDVEKQLQEYDPELYLMWNPKTGQHLIMDGVTELAIMKIPQIGFPELTSRVVGHIRSIRLGGDFSALEEIKRREEKKEQELKNTIHDISLNAAKDVYKLEKSKTVYMGA